MNLFQNADNLLRRFLKRKVKITDAVIVAFLITGGIGFAASVPGEVTQDGDRTYTIIGTSKEFLPGSYGNLAPLPNPEGVDIDAPNVSGVGSFGGDVNKSFKEIVKLDKPFVKDFDLDPSVAKESKESGIHIFTPIPIASITTNGGGISAIGGSILNPTVVINAGLLGGATYKYGMLAQGEGAIAINALTIGLGLGKGDTGMAAVDNGIAINIGNIYGSSIGIQNYGMVAIDKSLALNIGKISNKKDFGMLALDNSLAVNLGEISNGGKYGMAAVGGSVAVNAKILDSDIIGDAMDLIPWEELAEVILGGTDFGTIKNKGDYGMVAVDGSLAVNAGEIENTGKYGMAAIDKSLALNFGEISNTGDYGMLVQDNSIGENDGVIQNTGKYGMLASNQSIIVNTGTVANSAGVPSLISVDATPLSGDYGMVAVDHSLATNFGEVYNTGDFGVAAIDNSLALNFGIIANGGDYGMAAVDKSIAENDGLIANSGDYGMLALDKSSVINTGLISNENIGMAAVDHSLAINFEDVANVGDFGLLASKESVALNFGTVSNGGDYGMVATDDSLALNDGLVANSGDYGMLASDNGLVVNTGVVANGEEFLRTVGGDYGMVAVDHSLAMNFGEVSNTGDYGVVAADKSIALNFGEILNGGDYGMVAVDKSLVENDGLIANDGNFGMLASDLSIAMNTGLIANNGDVGMAATGLSTALNFGEISNNGNIGMLAQEAGLAINSGEILSSVQDYGMLATELGAVINTGLVANSGDVGIGATDLALAENFGTVANEGKYGMLANDLSLAVNHGTVENQDDIGMAALDLSRAVNKGTVANLGDYGMLAVNGSVVVNKGLVINDGDVGMAAISAEDISEVETGIAPLNLFDLKTVALNDGLVDNYGDVGMLALGAHTIAINEGVVGETNLENTGMLALDGGKVINKGTVSNTGNFGMVASGVNETHNYWFVEEDRSVALNEEGGVISSAVGEVGMAAFDGALAVNEGLIANSGTLGMFGENGSSIVNRGSSYNNPTDTNLLHNSQADAGIKNGGDFGMLVTNNSNELTLAANFGQVANDGDFGMFAAEAGSLALNVGHKTYETTILGHDVTLTKFGISGHGVVENNGDYGMAAVDGGIAVNNGLVANLGDVGMIASGEGSIVLNSNKLMYEIFQDPSKYWEVVGKLEKDYFLEPREGEHPDRSGIHNTGNFGMVAQNGALAINDGLIANGGNVGMLVYDGSLGVNTANGVIRPGYADVSGDKVGVYVLGGSAFVNNGTIEGEDGYAIYGGSGNNAIYLGTQSNISGKVNGSGGTNTLYFIKGDGELADVNIGQYGEIQANTFSHIAVAGDRATTKVSSDLGTQEPTTLTGTELNDYTESSAGYTLTVDKTLNLSASLEGKGLGYDADGSGVLSYDKFNSFQAEGQEMDGYANGGRFMGSLDIFTKTTTDNDSNVTVSKGDIRLKLAQTRVSTLVGENLNTVVGAEALELTDITSGTVTQRSFDEFFVTNANQIDVRNIMLSAITIGDGSSFDEQVTVVDLGLDSDGNKQIQVTIDHGDGTSSDFIISYENVTPGWEVRVEVALDGSVTSIYTRLPGAQGLAGGYASSVNDYTQSNVDLINTTKIVDSGYMYARKTAFLPKTTTIEEQILPAAPLDKPSSQERQATVGKESVPAPIPAVAEPAVLRTETTSQFKNLQYADTFGEAGKYDGSSGSGFDYDTWGVTGGTFHRFDENWLGGLSYGYAKSTVDYPLGKEKVDTLALNGLVSYQKDNWLATGLLGYSWNNHKLNREAFNNDSLEGDQLITVGTNKMNADFDSHVLTLGAEVGYNYVVDSTSYLYPYAGLDYTWYNRDSYKEAGGPDLALAIDETDYSYATSKLGLMYEKNWDKVQFTADLSWKHSFLDNESDAKTYGQFFNKLSSVKYEIPGLSLGKDTGTLLLGVDYKLSPQLNVGVEYVGFVRDGEVGNRGGVNFKYVW